MRIRRRGRWQGRIYVKGDREGGEEGERYGEGAGEVCSSPLYTIIR